MYLTVSDSAEVFCDEPLSVASRIRTWDWSYGPEQWWIHVGGISGSTPPPLVQRGKRAIIHYNAPQRASSYFQVSFKISRPTCICLDRPPPFKIPAPPLQNVSSDSFLMWGTARFWDLKAAQIRDHVSWNQLHTRWSQPEWFRCILLLFLYIEFQF